MLTGGRKFGRRWERAEGGAATGGGGRVRDEARQSRGRADLVLPLGRARTGVQHGCMHRRQRPAFCGGPAPAFGVAATAYSEPIAARAHGLCSRPSSTYPGPLPARTCVPTVRQRCDHEHDHEHEHEHDRCPARLPAAHSPCQPVPPPCPADIADCLPRVLRPASRAAQCPPRPSLLSLCRIAADQTPYHLSHAPTTAS